MVKPKVRAYECTVVKPDGCPATWSDGSPVSSTVCALSAGKAKSMYQIDMADAGWRVRFQDIRVRVLDSIPPKRQDDVTAVAKYRGVPFARLGMKVECGGQPGVIAGANSGANFDVLFTDGPNEGLTLNCHPNWKMRYFGDDGAEIPTEREEAR